MTRLWAQAKELAAETPATRNRYVDFLRAASVLIVVFRHWLMAAPHQAHSGLSLGDMLHAAPWTQWLTWVFQGELCLRLARSAPARLHVAGRALRGRRTLPRVERCGTRRPPAARLRGGLPGQHDQRAGRSDLVQPSSRPPTVALLFLGVFYRGLVLTFEQLARRGLADVRAWAATILVDARIMTLYLWHATALVLLVGAANAFGGVGMRLEPGSAAWWLSRPLWFAVLALALGPFVLVFSGFETRGRGAGGAAPAAWRAVVGAAGMCGGIAPPGARRYRRRRTARHPASCGRRDALWSNVGDGLVVAGDGPTTGVSGAAVNRNPDTTGGCARDRAMAVGVAGGIPWAPPAGASPPWR